MSIKKLFIFFWGGLLIIIEALLLYHYGVINSVASRLGFAINNAHEREDYWCIMGWHNSLKKMNINADICFWGDSITYDSDFASSFTEKRIVNLGYPGDDLSGMLVRYKQITAVHPKKVFIMAGINDLIKRNSIHSLRHDYCQLLDSIIYYNPGVQLILESILPVNHRMRPKLPSTKLIISANSIIEGLAKERGLVYVDLFPMYADSEGELLDSLTRDGIHLHPNSYTQWESAIKYLVEDDEVN